MSMFSILKHRLRNHHVFGNAYSRLAAASFSARVAAHEAFLGPYYTAARFNHLFRRTQDPWGYDGDPNAWERRGLLLAVIPPVSPRMLEIGCAEGWITASLAARAIELHAVDISTIALSRARVACQNVTNVRFSVVNVARDPLPGVFDSIICAGILVFVPSHEQLRVRESVVAALAPGGRLVLEHTRMAYPGELAGADIHALYANHESLAKTSHTDVANYAITVFEKRAR